MKNSIITLESNTPREQDEQVAEATTMVEAEGREVFATQTHVTWCKNNDAGWLEFTAVLFVRDKRL